VGAGPPNAEAPATRVARAKQRTSIVGKLVGCAGGSDCRLIESDLERLDRSMRALELINHRAFRAGTLRQDFSLAD